MLKIQASKTLKRFFGISLKHVRLWRWFFVLCGDYRQLFSIIALGMLQSMVALPIPLILSDFIKEAMVQGDRYFFLKQGCLLAVLFCVNRWIGYYVHQRALGFSQKHMADLRFRLMQKIYELPLSHHSDQSSKHMHTIVMQDIYRLDSTYHILVAQIAPALFLCVGLCSILAFVHTRFLLLGILFLIPFLIFNQWAIHKQEGTAIKLRRSLQNFNRGILSSLHLIEFTRMLGVESFELEKRKVEIDTLQKDEVNSQLVQRAVSFYQGLIFSIMGLIFLFAISGSGAGGNWAFSLLSLTLIMGVLRTQAKTLASSIGPYVQGTHALQNVHSFLLLESETNYIGIKPISFCGNIRLEKVSFAYRDHDVIRNLSISIQAGSFVGLSGFNGAGKTTLLRLILGLVEPREGVLFAEGIPYSLLDLGSLRRQIAVLPQEPALLSGTVEENISFGTVLTKEQLVSAVKIAGLEDFVESLPEKFSTFIGEHGARVSGGQRQRISIARAVARKPKLFIFDEPSNHMGVSETQLILGRIRNLFPSATLLVVSHIPEILENADKVISLQGGILPMSQPNLNTQLDTFSESSYKSPEG